MRYTCYTGKIHEMLLPLANELPSMVRHGAFTTHKHNCYRLNITGASQSYRNHQQAADTHRSSSSSTGAEKRQKHITTLTQKQQSCLCVTHRIFYGPFGSLERHAPPILLLWSLLLAGIWKQARQGTHYIHVPLSPACYKLPFPSPVGRQLIRQQWASQPASQRCELWALDHFLSPSLSLSLSLLLALLLPSCPRSPSITPSSSLSPFFLLAYRTVQWQPLKPVHLAFFPLLPLTTDWD